MSINKMLNSNLFSSLATILVKVFSGGFGYWMFIVFSKEMTINEYAMFTVLFSIVMFIGYVSNFGQQTLIVKELPALIDKKMVLEQGALRRFTYRISVLGMGIGSAVFVMLSLLFWQDLTWDVTVPAVVIICAFSMSQTTIGLLRVYGKTVQGIFTRDLLWRVATIILFVVCLRVVAQSEGVNWSPLSISLFCMAVTLLPILLYHLKLVRTAGTISRDNKRAEAIATWKGASIGFTVGVLIANADSYMYTILVGQFLTPYDTGLFFSSLKTVEIVSVFLLSVALVFAPKFSLSIKNGEHKKLQRKCNLALLIQGVPAIGCLFIMVVFAPDILALFNPDYQSQSNVLVVLAIAMAINALSGPTGILLQLSGMHWKYVQYQAVSIGMALILMPFVSDGFGIYGVCVLFLCSKLLWNLLSRKKIKETLGVEPSVLALFSSRHVSFYELKEDILEFR